MEAHDIVLATWEACANATEHGRSDSGFTVLAELADDDTVRVVVTDGGSWLPPAERSDRGRGVQLMRSLMSSVDIEPGTGGTRVTLSKRLLRMVDEPLRTAR
jgi:anti-sigma regulatory factor (Ser/Thr protein kinase)